MKKHTITQTRLKELLDYDPLTGVFKWRFSRPNASAGTITGNSCILGGKKYLRVGVDYSIYLAHRLAWLYEHGVMPDSSVEIDHIDGNGENNCIANLRLASRAMNTQNHIRAHLDNKSGHLGVSYHARDGLWRARISTGTKSICKYFKDIEDAKKCYVELKRQHHEGCSI